MTNRKNPSYSVRILDLIASKPEGMRFTEMQRALWEMSHPGQPFTRAQRCWWCGPLAGAQSYHGIGLLRMYCTKIGRQYVRNAVPHDGKPWSRIDKSQAKPGEFHF